MANYINTQTGAYPVAQSAIQQEYPNTSFPTPFAPPAPYVVVFQSPQPEYNWITQGLRELQPEETAGQYYQVWQVYDLTQDQIAHNQDQAKQINKQQAETLLQQTDWTATIDIADPQYSNPYLTNQNDFLAYRSQVRQIAVNPSVTVDVWPVKPSEIWSS